jgi:hypothetical protein
VAASGIVGPVCFDSSVIADCYLQEEFLPFLQGMGVSFGETFFQQAGA